MTIKDLMARLAALNPEAEVYVYGSEGWDEPPQPLDSIMGSDKEPFPNGMDPTPSDTLIVLSE